MVLWLTLSQAYHPLYPPHRSSEHHVLRHRVPAICIKSRASTTAQNPLLQPHTHPTCWLSTPFMPSGMSQVADTPPV
mgnify:CR=1 FL=1